MFDGSVVIVGGALGDVLYHVPHIEAVAARSRRGKIVLGCKKAREIGELVRRVPYVEAVVGIADDQDISGKVSLATLTRKLRALQAEAVFCLHGSATVALACLLAGIPQRFGPVQGRFAIQRLCFNRGVAVPAAVAHPPMMHKAEILLEASGLSIDNDATRFRQPDDYIAECWAELPELPRPLIALGVNSSKRDKQWGGERFRRLVELLPESCGYVLFGGADVRDEAAPVVDLLEARGARYVDLTGMGKPLSFAHSVLQRCDLYVGNDSFGFQLSAMTGLPTIGLFGPNRPIRYNKHILALEPEPGAAKDMAVISAERVAAAVLERLSPYARWPQLEVVL